MRGLLAAFDGGGLDMIGGEILRRVECGACWRLLTGADFGYDRRRNFAAG